MGGVLPIVFSRTSFAICMMGKSCQHILRVHKVMTFSPIPPQTVFSAPDDTSVSGYSVRELMQGGDKVFLILDGTPYSLRITRAGKLILTK